MNKTDDKKNINLQVQKDKRLQMYEVRDSLLFGSKNWVTNKGKATAKFERV
jgi:hypothetical protein